MVRWCDGAMVRWCDGAMVRTFDAGVGGRPLGPTPGAPEPCAEAVLVRSRECGLGFALLSRRRCRLGRGDSFKCSDELLESLGCLLELRGRKWVEHGSKMGRRWIEHGSKMGRKWVEMHRILSHVRPILTDSGGDWGRRLGEAIGGGDWGRRLGEAIRAAIRAAIRVRIMKAPDQNASRACRDG